MGFKLLILNPTDSLVDRRTLDRWPDKLKKAIPDIEVTICHSDGEAMEAIEDAVEFFDDGDVGFGAGKEQGTKIGVYMIDFLSLERFNFDPLSLF